MSRVHLDTDYLIRAVTTAGEERRRLLELAASKTLIEMSAVAWYEFTRGPRSPEDLALAALFLEEDDIVPFGAELASRAAETFRRLNAPRRRANDLAIGTTAAAAGATLWTLNDRDFDGIPGLRLGP